MRKKEIEKSQNVKKKKKKEASNEARGQSNPTSSSGRPRLLSGTSLRVNIAYTNADGLVV